MNRKQKALALALSSLVALSAALTGCGEPAAPAASSSAPAADSSAPAAEPLHLNILAPNNSNQFLKFDDREEYPVWQELNKLFAEKNLTLDFEVVAPDQYDVTCQTRIAAGNSLPDVMNLTPFADNDAMNLANRGTILPINTIADEYGDGTFNRFIREEYPFMEQLTTAPDGNIYWFTSVQVQTYQEKSAPTCRVINIRKDWLEKLNLEVPATAEEFLAVMKAFRDQDANGNGQKDEILTLDSPSELFMTGIAQWFGVGNYLTSIDVKNGKVVSPWYQEGVQDYFKYMQTLVNEGILDTDLVGASYEQTQQRMTENKVGATFTYCMQTWLEPSVNADGAEYLPIALLKAGEYTPYNVIEPPFFSWHKWVVTKDCKSPEAVAALLDVLYSAKYEELTAWGIEGETYEVVDGRRQLMEGIGNAYWEQMAADKKTPGAGLWAGCVFPTVSLYTMESQFASRPDYKNEFQKSVAFYENVYPDSNYCYLAIASDEQNQRKAELTTDLTTYSSELATDFILGRASFDKWDEYIQQLKDLGLDDLIAIEQSQLDKFNELSK